MNDALRKIQHQELRRNIAMGIEQIMKNQIAPLDMEAIMTKGRKLLTQRRKTAYLNKDF